MNIIKGKIISIYSEPTISMISIKTSKDILYPIYLEPRCLDHIIKCEGDIYDREVLYNTDIGGLVFI